MKLGLPRVIKTRKPHTASVPQIISEAQMSGPSWRTFKQFNKGTQPFSKYLLRKSVRWQREIEGPFSLRAPESLLQTASQGE